MGGLASSGQLGVGGLSSDVYTLSGKSNVVRTDGQIASNVLSMTSSVGGVHSAYADSDGYVWAFGKNDKGQIANQDVTSDFTTASMVGSDLIITLDSNEILVKKNQESKRIGMTAHQGFNLYEDEQPVNVSTTYRVLDSDIASVDGYGQVSAESTGKTYVEISARGDDNAEKRMYVHIISLPDDTEVKAENADEEYIAYPQISAGDNFILALRANGDLYAWGDNTYGQLGLGLGRVGSIDMKPQKLNVTKTVTEITTGADGEDVVTSREVPVKFTKIAAGPDFAMAIDVDGNLYTWGRNNNGQIGNGTDTSDFIDEKNPSEVSNKETLVPSPQMVAYFTDYNVVMQDISAGGSVGNSYAMALSSNGDVFAWGSNKFKQVENSDNEIVSTPVYVPVSRMTSIAAGKGDEFTTSYGVQELGKVLAMG